MAGATIGIHFADVASERRFLRSYLVDAWERFEAADHWEHGWFWPYGQFAHAESGPDGGFVRLVFDGDPEALVAAERDRWDAVDGLTDWAVTRYDDPEAVDETYESLLAQQRAAKGAVGGEREYRFKALTARLALACYEAFDERLAPAPDPDEADPLGLGVWALCHDLLVQLGYDWYDETDAATRMLRSRVKSVAGYRGAEAARAEYEAIRDDWLAFEDELETWLDERPTGGMSEP